MPSVKLVLASPDDTAALARWLAPRLVPGDVVLLDGPTGAGKSHFCRSLIQARMAAEGWHEDVPSPTFTLVQIYDLANVSIWHADLYRLTSPEQALELGLEEAFSDAVTLIEWPDRLGDLAPKTALTMRISLNPESDIRTIAFCATAPRWTPVLARLAEDRPGENG